MSVSMGTNSLLLVPANFNPNTQFGKFHSSGLIHNVGTTLTVSASQEFDGQGSVGDPVVCQGTISAAAYVGIYLENGLTLSGTGNVSLGTGSLIVNDSGSQIMSGSLSAGYQLVGNSGTGAFTQSGGTSIVGQLYLGYNTSSSSGAYTLNGSGLLSVGAAYVGSAGTGTFTQSGGTGTFGSLSLGSGTGSRGTYNLNGGMLILSGLTEGPGTAAFNFSGGTLLAGATFSTGGSIGLSTSGGNAIIDTAGNALTVSGLLSGSGNLIKAGSGTLALAATNRYVGNTTITAGTLQLGNAKAAPNSTIIVGVDNGLAFGSGVTAPILGGLAGSGNVTLATVDSSPLAVALTVGGNNADTTYSGSLSGSGSLLKTGTGQLMLSGASTYSGSTAVNAGQLMINGSLVSPVTVNAGGTLSGTGSLASVTVTAGGYLAPGDSPGVMQLSGSLTLLSGAMVDYELDTPGSSDEISMPNELLTLGSQQFSDFNFTTSDGFGPGVYTLIVAGSISGSLGANLSGTVDGLPATLAVQENDLVLVVPEPAALALLGAGAIGLARYGWRKRKQG
jgi:autotransporter-associated beta strand protein